MLSSFVVGGALRGDGADSRYAMTSMLCPRRKDVRAMQGSIRIGTIRGIPLFINASWLIVFGLFVWLLGTSYFPEMYPGWTGQAYFAAGIVTTILFFASLIVHEFGHALTAEQFGIHTRRITLLPIGGLAEIEREPAKASQEFAIAIAGPLTSLLLGGIFLGLSFLVDPVGVALGGIAAYLGVVNMFLAVFNLIPGFPMDGGRVLRAIVWGITKSYTRATRIAAGIGSVIAFGFIGVGILLAFSGLIVTGIMLVLVGWFIVTSARASVSQLALQRDLAGVTVAQVMTRDVAAIQMDTTLADAVNGTFLARNRRVAAVLWSDRFVGIVTLADVMRVPHERWEWARVEEVMVPAARLVTAQLSDPALAAIQRMGQADVNQLPVIEDGHLIGILSRNDVLRFVQLRELLHLPSAPSDDRSPPQTLTSVPG
jgi:Zn-dependent protease/CBS domain-containing protein